MKLASNRIVNSIRLPILVALQVVLVACGATFDPDKPRKSGERHIEITVATEAHWINGIAIDSLNRRILGLNWNTQTVKGSNNRFKIWPIPNLEVSDSRIYQLSKMYEQDPWVLSVTPHYEDAAFIEPTDGEGLLPHDDPQWYLGPRGINAYAAWELFKAKGKKPGEGVIVGLPDTGYFDHPELFRADGSTQLRLDLQRNYSEPENFYDAHDYCNTFCGLTLNKTYKMAYSGHGTTTASMIISPAERHPDTIGMYHAEGGAPFAELIPMRVSPTVLLTPTSMANLAKAIAYADSQGAKVISIALGGFTNKDEALRAAITSATENGVIVVTAAGNGPWGVGATLLYVVSKPASYPETIAVCGSNALERPWKDSSNGKAVDICAPAENIRRARSGWINLTKHVNDTDQSEGTSMSASLVASVAALWISYHGYDSLLAHYNGDPSKVPEAFREIITTTGKRTPQDWPAKRYGAGIIDAELILRAPLPML